MSRRSVTRSTNAPPGESILLGDQGVPFTLFIPPTWPGAVTNGSTLTAHFHSAAWFPIQEHLRHGSASPLVCFQLGEGSGVYRKAFLDTNRFSRVLRLVEHELKRRSATASARISRVDVSSFSAGYGAVRELIKSPEYFSLIQRIVLLDSMYASYDAAAADVPSSSPREKGQTSGRPAPEHIAPWVPFARAAMLGQKSFVFTHSAVPTAQYANSAACATALVAAVGATSHSVAPNSLPAASDPDFPLRARCDAGRFHVWSYAGDDAQAHITHVQHMADVWLALDRRSP